MAQLNDTLVNGDLRVNGKIYGIITSADSATNASNLGSTAASDFALKNGNYSSNGLVAKSASTAATANAAKWTEKSDDRTYRVAFSEDAQFYYSKQFNYNAGTQTLCAKNISSVNITGTVSGNLSGSAASALTSKSALSAGYATSAGAAPVASHNHNYQLSGNGTALYISAGVNLKPNGNIAISTAANTINISAKDTTYTSLNSINSTEYNALTSTSANSRNPNAHQLSSHTNFTTYFNGTSANSALTSKSALSAGYATSAGAAPVASHNHNYQISGNGTALYISAGVNLKPNGNIAISTAANTINISAKDTTYSTLNSINTNEYNALTSTSANSRNPNAHQLSSHTNFSTYFNGTSANSALTSKSALSAGTAARLYVTEHSTNNTTYYPVWANGVGNAVRDILTTTAKLTFNPALGQLYISNIVKVGGCSMTWNASTSALDFNF